MIWMNQWEVRDAEERFRYHAVLGPAARFLREFVEEVNAHSDGWPYWTPPARAANKLMELVHGALASTNTPEPTRFDIERALIPIKAFMTKRGYAAGMSMPTLEWVTQQRLV